MARQLNNFCDIIYSHTICIITEFQIKMTISSCSSYIRLYKTITCIFFNIVYISSQAFNLISDRGNSGITCIIS